MNNQDKEKVIYPELSYKIIGTVFDVFNSLGYGYQEKYYQKALAVALKDNDIEFKEQVPTKILYKNNLLGIYFLDFLVDDKIVLEIKKSPRFSRKNIEQVYAYLKATNLKLGILVNFSPNDVKFKRILNLN